MSKSIWKIFGLLSISILIFWACNPFATQLSDAIPEVDKKREAKLLTAFWGLDNELPLRALLLHKKAFGKDGMPLVFSQEIDPTTLQAADIEIQTADGSLYTPHSVTFKPAYEAFELRTVLLIGEYGNYPENPPVSVSIVGDLMSRSGKNYKGQSIEVIPLEEGPIISYAEYFTFTDDYPYVEKGRGCDCPKEETKMVVRTVWSGGVRAVNGKDLGKNELNDFEVLMLQGNDTISVNPFHLGDLKDSDNNIDLCLKQAGIPISVKANQHIAIDPRDDMNPMTEISVQSRW